MKFFTNHQQGGLTQPLRSLFLRLWVFGIHARKRFIIAPINNNNVDSNQFDATPRYALLTTSGLDAGYNNRVVLPTFSSLCQQCPENNVSSLGAAVNSAHSYKYANQINCSFLAHLVKNAQRKIRSLKCDGWLNANTVVDLII